LRARSKAGEGTEFVIHEIEFDAFFSKAALKK
jgi:hypothetical protein